MTAKKIPTSFPNLSETELLNLEKASRESNPRQKRTAKKIKHRNLYENLKHAKNSMIQHLQPVSVLCDQTKSFEMPSLDIQSNLTCIKNVI